MHTPVLLHSVIEALHIIPGGKYIDATVGEGGHTKAMLEKGAHVLGLDWNEGQLESLKARLQHKNLILAQSNFAYIAAVAAEKGFVPADGILFDLGLSWQELSKLGRGFSYRNVQEPLDMRLDNHQELTAEVILNSYTLEKLYEMFARNSEEIHSNEIAQQIIWHRRKRKYISVGDLNKSIDTVVGANAGKTYNRIYQALRIEVNNEFDNLEKGLSGAVSILSPGGRIAVISFHSLEDRIVKQFIKKNKLNMTEKKAILGNQELHFERSAKLRIFTI